MTHDSQQKDVKFSELALKKSYEELQFSLVLGTEVSDTPDIEKVSEPPQKEVDRKTDIEKTKKYIESLYKPKPLITVARIVPDGSHTKTVGFAGLYKNSERVTKYPPKKPLFTTKEAMYRDLADLPEEDQDEILDSLDKDKGLIAPSNKPSRFSYPPQPEQIVRFHSTF